jgi:two-component system nitrate/nitrite response regulator NarL
MTDRANARSAHGLLADGVYERRGGNIMDDQGQLSSAFARTGERPVRVVIADDECMFRTSLRQLLAVPPAVVKDVYGVDVGRGFDVVGEARTGEETLQTVRQVAPDLLLLDISMPRMSGLDALRELQSGGAPPRTIILSGAVDGENLLTAIQLGARGVVPKDSTTELLFEAITCVVAGRAWVGQTLITDLMDMVRTLATTAAHSPSAHTFGLTPREREVLSLVVEGCANKEIAQRFSVSEETIKHHLTRMFDKVGASNRLELALVATRHHLVN